MPTAIRSLDLTVLKYADYQRPLDHKRVEHIVKNYDPNSIGVPCISERDGALWVVDGQHRVYALLDLGVTSHRCEVHQGMTYQDEAREFSLRNNFKNLTPLARFIASVHAGDAESLDIVAIVKDAGWKPPINRSKTSGKNGYISAVSALVASYRMGRQEFKDAAAVLYRAWPNNVNAMGAYLIKAVTSFLVKYGQAVDKESLISRLKMYPGGPKALVSEARSGINAYAYDYAHEAVEAAILSVYNKGRRQKLAGL